MSIDGKAVEGNGVVDHGADALGLEGSLHLIPPPRNPHRVLVKDVAWGDLRQNKPRDVRKKFGGSYSL